MDVHPPHEPVHTWREALTHIAIMTVGLFIALMLEGLVEYAQHKHTVREARANIRQELQDNHKSAQNDITSLGQDFDRVKVNIKTLRAMEDGPRAHHSLDFHMQWNDMSETAWTTARDTGALSYMPYEEVQHDADIYGLQSTVNAQFISIFHRETESFAPVVAEDDFAGIPKSRFEEMIHEDQVVLVDLYTAKQLLQQLDQQYLDTLKKS